MPSLEIRQAVTKKDLRTFAAFPWRIYQNDPLWVPPLLRERLKTIDPQTGAFFKHGTAEYFTAWRNGRPVGTICTAIDFKANQAVNKRECVFGFWECENDEQIARALLDHAVEWAKDHDLNSLYGPFNLDYEDAYGVMVGGLDRPPCDHVRIYG